MTEEEIQRLLFKPTISPTELYRTKVYPLGLAGIYQAIHAGQIDALRFGRKIAIVTAPLRKKLGIEEDRAA